MGEGEGAGLFPQDFVLLFFLTVREPKYIFQDKAKNIYIFFFLTGIYARNVFFKILMFVYFLNPIYMGILFICSCIHVSWIFGSEFI